MEFTSSSAGATASTSTKPRGNNFVEQERELLGVARADQNALAVTQNFGFDDVIEFERRGGQLRSIRAADQDLHGMIADFSANFFNLAFGNDVAAAHQHDAVGDAVDLFQNVAGDDDVHALLGDGFKERDGFGASHGIEAVERFVENQHRRMMRNGLSQANALAHAFAVACDFAAGDLRHAGALEGFVRELGGLIVAKSVKTQRPINEVVAVRAGREGVELRAVAHLAEELDGLLGREAEDVNRAVGRLDQAGQQVHQAWFCPSRSGRPGS